MKRTTIILPEETLKWLKYHSIDIDVSMNKIINTLIQEYMEPRSKK